MADNATDGSDMLFGMPRGSFWITAFFAFGAVVLTLADWDSKFYLLFAFSAATLISAFWAIVHSEWKCSMRVKYALAIGTSLAIALMLQSPLRSEIDKEHRKPSLVFVIGVPLGENDSPIWTMMVQHYGPSPAYNCAVELYDSDRKNIEHEWLVAHPTSSFPPKIAGDSQYISPIISEADPMRGSASTFNWNVLNPDQQHYSITTTCRDGVFVENWEVSRVSGTLRTKIEISRGPRWIEDNPNGDPVILRCVDPEFHSTPIASEIPKIIRHEINPGWKPNHRFEFPVAILDPNGHLQVMSAVKLPSGGQRTDFGCWNLLTKHAGERP